MKTRSGLAVPAAIATAAITVLGFAGTSLADPPGTLTDPPNHRHFIETAKGKFVPVGPRICGNPEMQQAFNAFHYNVHHSGGVPTLGPQAGAPGLHNSRGAEVVGLPGCG